MEDQHIQKKIFFENFKIYPWNIVFLHNAFQAREAQPEVTFFKKHQCFIMWQVEEGRISIIISHYMKIWVPCSYPF